MIREDMIMENTVLDILEELCEDDIVRRNTEVELFESGLLDSLAFAELIYKLEDALGVMISPSEVTREEIDTPRKIIELVRGRLNG